MARYSFTTTAEKQIGKDAQLGLTAGTFPMLQEAWLWQPKGKDVSEAFERMDRGSLTRAERVNDPLFRDSQLTPPHPAETTGLPRLLEALTTTDWDSGAAAPPSPSPDLDVDLDVDFDDPTALVAGIAAAEARELNRPMLAHPDRHTGDGEHEGATDDGARARGDGGDGAEDEAEAHGVEALQALLLQVQAVRDLAAEVPAAERRRWAARAVRDVMRGV